jgi:acyl-homoserine-lactone acylase
MGEGIRHFREMKLLFFYVLVPVISIAQQFSAQEISRYQKQAENVTIFRDNWGIPHVYGKTDADAVFGLLYAECEADFKRVEKNYLEVMGRQAEAYGESFLYNDLQIRLIEDSADALNDYKICPLWMQKLLDAFADGVNYYLYKHPEVKPFVLKRFKPWFPLMFTDGSVSATSTGGIRLGEIQNFYLPNHPGSTAMIDKADAVPQWGSNGFAIAPSRTASKNAMLYINPHVPFYFRMEVQLVSQEGLNAYGAVTWGQFFVYQGFNEHCGWMHTSSAADVADLYEEKVSQKEGVWFYEYDKQLKPVKTKEMVIRYKKDSSLLNVTLTGFYTQHGPVMGSRNGSWLSLKEYNRSINALLEAWLITKANNFSAYKQAMELRANTTNNTVYADDRGNIAYWHGNFMPKRNPSLDWSLPVSGEISATEWQGIHSLDEIVHIYNPSSGWIQNCNSTPFSVAGSSSPERTAYPVYMAPDDQNPRAINAIRLLSQENNFTIDKLIAVGYDHYLSAFDILLPGLFKAYREDSLSDSIKKHLDEPMRSIKFWDRNASISSVPTTLAIWWANKLAQRLPDTKSAVLYSNAVGRLNELAMITSNKEKLDDFEAVIKDLEKRYGSWKIPWGEINRYQRNTGGLTEKFDDLLPSLPVGFCSSRWGSLPAFESRAFPGTKNFYGVSGNSFIAAVEFGKRLKAKSVVTGGQSNDPGSQHFMDQASQFLEGKFKDVLFYKEDLMKQLEKKYHPGE